ncbi:MAG: putative serine/threonine-protein kinase pknH [Labilithrix sp.]|nr:putative serine/threonine-protein kinase pknH [Labilithrix sp.]
MMRRMLVGGAVLVTAASVAACSAVLGFDTFALDPGGASEAGSGDASGDGSGEGGADAGDLCAAADLKTSKQHCGRCDHACAGGDCQGGVCRPLLLADGLASPEGLVVDDTSVFVAEWEANRIVRLDRTPHGECDVVPLAPGCIFADENADHPTGMGIDATHVYWATTDVPSGYSIRSCPRAGCGGSSPLEIIRYGQQVFYHDTEPDNLVPLDLVVRDGQIFYPLTGTGVVASVAADGSHATKTYYSGTTSPLAVAVDDGSVYFTSATGFAEIYAVPRDETKVVRKVVGLPARGYGLALAASGTLYWTVPMIEFVGDGLLQSAPATAMGDDALGSLASTLSDPRMVIVDTKNVYWTSHGRADKATGAILTCPLEGCAGGVPTVLANGQRAPKHITQDDAAIYWTNEGLGGGTGQDGQVWKVAKP